MTIIRNQSDIAEASTADLVETYNALVGKSIKKFENRSIAEARTRMAILAAENAAGHAGVTKGECPAAKTVAEIAAKGKTSSAIALGEADEESASQAPAEALEQPVAPAAEPVAATLAAAPETNPYKPGTMAHQLWVATASMAKVERKPTKAEKKTEAPARSAITHVRLTGRGTSKLQAASLRNSVFEHIKNRPGGVASLAELDEHFQTSCRGHIQKLIGVDHIEPISAEEAAKLIAAAAKGKGK